MNEEHIKSSNEGEVYFIGFINEVMPCSCVDNEVKTLLTDFCQSIEEIPLKVSPTKTFNINKTETLKVIRKLCGAATFQ